MRRKLSALAIAFTLAATAFARTASAWSHQGHILIARMACLRIINDPKAPEGLKTFLKANMKYDLDACKKLVESEYVGPDAKDYLAGIDGAATYPDRIVGTDEGDAIVQPYGTGEAKLHFLDMEYFSKDPTFKPDLSNLPKITDFPHDPKDARYKAAGFVPFRVEEFYGKLVADFGKKELDEKQTLRDFGFLAHYVGDCTQPQHSTVDYKSLSYLAGKIKSVKAVTRKNADGKEYTSYQIVGNAKINPHGDVEYQLFENTDEPRKVLRQQFWTDFNKQIDAIAAELFLVGDKRLRPGSFQAALGSLTSGYSYLPAIGEAAQAAYANESFDPKAFFTHEVTVESQKSTMLTLIARQHAIAVVNLEATLRQAWAEAHP